MKVIRALVRFISRLAPWLAENCDAAQPLPRTTRLPVPISMATWPPVSVNMVPPDGSGGGVVVVVVVVGAIGSLGVRRPYGMMAP